MHTAPPPSMASDGIWTKTDEGDNGHQHQVEGAEDRTDAPAMSNMGGGDPRHRSLSSSMVVSNSKISVFSGVRLEN